MSYINDPSAKPSKPRPGSTRAVSLIPKHGAQLIAEERQRQVEKEGWTPEHDDKHDLGELCNAAHCYLFAGDWMANGGKTPTSIERDILKGHLSSEVSWPWDDGCLKISDDPIRNLVKAGSLIAAEIDRLQRLKESEGKS